MKKTYINPQLTIMNVRTQPIMEASAGFGSGTKNGADACSRFRNKLWEDDEDDWLLDENEF